MSACPKSSLSLYDFIHSCRGRALSGPRLVLDSQTFALHLWLPCLGVKSASARGVWAQACPVISTVYDQSPTDWVQGVLLPRPCPLFSPWRATFLGVEAVVAEVLVAPLSGGSEVSRVGADVVQYDWRIVGSQGEQQYAVGVAASVHAGRG